MLKDGARQTLDARDAPFYWASMDGDLRFLGPRATEETSASAASAGLTDFARITAYRGWY
jgi:hypothetical protein